MEKGRLSLVSNPLCPHSRRLNLRCASRVKDYRVRGTGTSARFRRVHLYCMVKFNIDGPKGTHVKGGFTIPYHITYKLGLGELGDETFKGYRFVGHSGDPLGCLFSRTSLLRYTSAIPVSKTWSDPCFTSVEHYSSTGRTSR